jgi:hypothetical protein
MDPSALALKQALIVIHHQRLRLGIGHLPEGDKFRLCRTPPTCPSMGFGLVVISLPSIVL